MKPFTVFAAAFTIAITIGFMNGSKYVNNADFLKQQALQPVELFFTSDLESEQPALKTPDTSGTDSVPPRAHRETTKRNSDSPNKDLLVLPPFFREDFSVEALQEYIERESSKEVYELVYRHEGKVLYRFNTKTKKLTSSEDATFLELEKGYKPAIKYPIDGEAVTVLLGGSTAGITVTGLLSKTGSIPKRVVIAGILGAVSGYSLGFKLATLSPPGPESEKIQLILKDENQWKQYEKVLFRYLATEIFRMAEGIQDPMKSESFKKQAVIFFRASKGEPTTYEWMRITRVFNEIAQVTSAKPVVGSHESFFPFWLRWWWVGLIVVMAWVGLAIVLNWKDGRVSSKI